MAVTKETIMKMGLEARLEAETFCVDTFENLIRKYENIRDEESFLEESIKKLLEEQIIETIKTNEKRKAQLDLMSMVNEHLFKKE